MEQASTLHLLYLFRISCYKLINCEKVVAFWPFRIVKFQSDSTNKIKDNVHGKTLTITTESHSSNRYFKHKPTCKGIFR